ncbi:hypothetical protein Vadar_025483 [Vaccinium darrowii]|uniref:Uncharacterized protein n=1 Tax=Vaccinium darrowii TaxID=229202 RepID=A0ACB7ZLA9_9ERIC|nr:hypothetical protein Vadar_025483 [Vaccinium darrowii]
MPPPHSQRSLKGFLGKVSYLRRFVPALAEIITPLGDLLKVKERFEWKDKHQVVFEKVKAVLASPQTMVSPQKGEPLILYLASTTKSIWALLAQEVDGVERPVYYISRKVQGAEERYTLIEPH